MANVNLGGSSRLIIWVPHPNARGKRNLTEILSEMEINLIRQSLDR